jgi:hypothetical protein
MEILSAMRSASELFEELEEVYQRAVQEEGNNLYFLQLVVAFPETTISVAADGDGLNVVAEAMNAGGIPVGYISAIKQSDTLVFKWAPLDEFRLNDETFERANCFLNAIAEAAAWELKRARG